MLLCIDAGIKFGFALWNAEGELLRFGSHNVGNATRLKAQAWHFLRACPELQWLVIEGGGSTAAIWKRVAEKQGVRVWMIHAELWRNEVFPPRDRRSGVQAKHNADALARKIISESPIPVPKTLRHDAAEAILAGNWAMQHLPDGRN